MSVRKLFAGLLCVMLIMSLCACGEDQKASAGATETPTTSVAPTTTAPEPTQMEITAENLEGTWISIKGGDEDFPVPDENQLYTNELCFFENGAYLASDYDYFYQRTGNDVWKWVPGGRSYEGLCGKYQVEDGKVIISQMFNDYVDYGDETKTYEILYLDENKLVINDSWGTYVRAEAVSQDDLEALCRAVGVEYAPKKQEE